MIFYLINMEGTGTRVDETTGGSAAGNLYRFSRKNSEVCKGGISGCRKNVQIMERFFENHYNR